ncbi:hypothetical protein NBRC10512_002429 [Rhodotorula toruloides]|uniref:RHTO0S03e05556g1_1 n=2 Tax=Rhodotorula toruloides TaxID=5286 RepID=A0A061AM19_RHOTO|nr:uncharacterized protein RHTO_00281 [Rhodotorula toruloides NP11]EMS25853.1 hypothetical protein RHTO_00281 [Rhodotorula toruloides NP11]KAJ8295959.1 hypothetical protein OF846_001291 [Rhodotorula toruloides]CDR38194.1 RHTO0S03e05556g1_1 [Rhodotorula toruloides]
MSTPATLEALRRVRELRVFLNTRPTYNLTGLPPSPTPLATYSGILRQLRSASKIVLVDESVQVAQKIRLVFLNEAEAEKARELCASKTFEHEERRLRLELDPTTKPAGWMSSERLIIDRPNHRVFFERTLDPTSATVDADTFMHDDEQHCELWRSICSVLDAQEAGLFETTDELATLKVAQVADASPVEVAPSEKPHGQPRTPTVAPVLPLNPGGDVSEESDMEIESREPSPLPDLEQQLPQPHTTPVGPSDSSPSSSHNPPAPNNPPPTPYAPLPSPSRSFSGLLPTNSSVVSPSQGNQQHAYSDSPTSHAYALSGIGDGKNVKICGLPTPNSYSQAELRNLCAGVGGLEQFRVNPVSLYGQFWAALRYKTEEAAIAAEKLFNGFIFRGSTLLSRRWAPIATRDASGHSPQLCVLAPASSTFLFGGPQLEELVSFAAIAAEQPIEAADLSPTRNKAFLLFATTAQARKAALYMNTHKDSWGRRLFAFTDDDRSWNFSVFDTY